MEKVLGRDRGSMKRFFLMFGKVKLPYVWIIGYILMSFFLTNMGISITEYTAELFAGNVNFATVIMPFIIFQAINLVFGSISTIVEGCCTARIDRNFRRMIWGKIVLLPYLFFGKNEPKELISRITTDVSVMSRLIMQVFVSIITTCYSVFMILKKIGSYDQKLMYTLLAVIPLNMIIAFVMGNLKFGINDIINLKNAVLTRIIGERTKNIVLIKSRNTEDAEYETGSHSMKDLYHGKIMNAWMGLSTSMYTIAGMIQFIIIVLVGRNFYSSGALSLAQWIAYFGFANTIVNTLSAYCGYWETLKSTQGSTARVAQIMNEESEELDCGKEIENLSGDMKVNDLSFTYEEKMLFDHLNIRIPSGKVTAIVGPSGSGKTTLMNLISRLYAIDPETIYFGETDISELSLSNLRKQISYITQEATLFSGTIKDNLLYGIDRECKKEDLEVFCEPGGILEFVNEQPHGFETFVGEGGANLSGGEKQKISFVRAILKDSNYLLMDEGTAAMDIRMKDQIWTLLSEKMKKRTTLLVTHDCQTLLHADYVIVMNNGTIEAQGELEEMLRINPYCQNLTGKGDVE